MVAIWITLPIQLELTVSMSWLGLNWQLAEKLILNLLKRYYWILLTCIVDKYYLKYFKFCHSQENFLPLLTVTSLLKAIKPQFTKYTFINSINWWNRWILRKCVWLVGIKCLRESIITSILHSGEMNLSEKSWNRHGVKWNLILLLDSILMMFRNGDGASFILTTRDTWSLEGIP